MPSHSSRVTCVVRHGFLTQAEACLPPVPSAAHLMACVLPGSQLPRLSVSAQPLLLPLQRFSVFGFQSGVILYAKFNSRKQDIFLCRPNSIKMRVNVCDAAHAGKPWASRVHQVNGRRFLASNDPLLPNRPQNDKILIFRDKIGQKNAF